MNEDVSITKVSNGYVVYYHKDEILGGSSAGALKHISDRKVYAVEDEESTFSIQNGNNVVLCKMLNEIADFMKANGPEANVHLNIGLLKEE